MKLSLATRIFLGYAAVLVAFGAVSLFSVAQMHENQREMRLLGDQGYLSLLQATSALESFPDNEKRELERIHAETNPETRRALIRLVRLFPESNAARLDALQRTADALLVDPPSSEQVFIQQLLGRAHALRSDYEDSERLAGRLCDLLAQADLPREPLERTWQSYRAQIDRVGREIKQLRAELESRVRSRVEDAEVRGRRTGLTILGLSLLAIAVGLIATAVSARALRPVRTLVEGVSRIARGDYSTQLGVRGEDEIALLAREFDSMARALREREAQLREKQEALLRAEQLAAVGRVSAQVAHEVRNPLSSIGLNIELLQEAFAAARFGDERTAQEAREVLASVLREVDRLTAITEQYLKMARLPQPSLAPEDLNAVLRSVLDFSSPELERARVSVVKDLDPQVPPALADEGQLRQVFLNLVRNSKEAMQAGGTLKVSSRAAPDGVEVRISDSGAGLSGEAKERLFQPFFSTKEGGTGLGLAVSRQILQAHGGSIDCESGNGGGTTFVIRLPRA